MYLFPAMKIIIKGEAKTFLTKYKQKRVSAIEEYFVKKFCVAEGAPGKNYIILLSFTVLIHNFNNNSFLRFPLYT